MHIVISTFAIPNHVSRAELVEKFGQSAPIYRDLEGLISKHYLLGDGHETAGGVYVFSSKADADAWFTPEKIAWAEDRFGQVTLQHFDVPINLTTAPPDIHVHPSHMPPKKD